MARARAEAHHTTPLSTLKDTSAFAPPPKRTSVYGADSGSSIAESPTREPRPVPALSPLRGGYGAREQQQHDSEDDEPRSNSPFRADTTGLSIANLPKPPTRRLDSPGASTSPQLSAFQSTNTIKKPPPPLPPRLPPRTAVAGVSLDTSSSPPPSYNRAALRSSATKPDATAGLLNQGAINRLSAAGVSVPGFNIGSQSRTAAESSTAVQHVHAPPPPPLRANMSELQSRFAALGSAVSSRVAEEHGSVGFKKQPAPPPSRKDFTSSASRTESQEPPPPVPLATKPR